MAPTPAMSAEEKNARMTEERAFLTKLLESSLQGDFDTVKQHVQDYRGKHPAVSEQEVLSQFKDGKKRTAVHFMSQSSSPDIMEKLIQWFVDSDKDFLISILKMKDMNGMTALMMCAQNPDPQLACQRVKALLQVGGKPLALARSNAGAGALHYAAGAGALAETINALVEAGKVALSTPSRKGGTPLHWAAALRDDFSETTLKALVEAGADLNISNESGLSPLLLAAAAGNDKHAKYLVQQGTDVTKELPGSITIYHMAADCNLVGTLAILLEKYPDQSQLVSQPNGRNERPIDLAVQEGNLGCVMLLTGESDEDKAKAFMAEHQKSLPARNDASTKPASAPAEPKKDTAQYSLLEEHAKELGAKAVAMLVSDEDKARAQDIKKEGNQHYVKKEWQLAIDFYTKAIDADPTDAAFYSNRSACYMQLKQHDEALQDAVICRQLRPTWPKGCFRMAVARLALKRYEDAALSAWEGLQQDQNNDELKSLLQKCVKHGRKVHQDTVQKDHEEDDT
jgi:ankyrin repeat protein